MIDKKDIKKLLGIYFTKIHESINNEPTAELYQEDLQKKTNLSINVNNDKILKFVGYISLKDSVKKISNLTLW